MPWISLPASAARSLPWKNGLGLTTEYLRFPADATLETFAWRFSRAHLTEVGPWSPFPACTRHLLLLAPDVAPARPLLTLEHTDPDTGHATQRQLDAFQLHTFSGDARTRALSLSAPTDDLNLIVRRPWSATLELVTLAPGQHLTLVPASSDHAYLAHLLVGSLLDAPTPAHTYLHLPATQSPLTLTATSPCRLLLAQLLPHQP